MKKRIYLIVNGHYPTIHQTIDEANKYLEDIPATAIKFYCSFSNKDFKENFANCVFFQVLKNKIR